MREPIEILVIYLELYRASLQRQRPLVATRFLVIAVALAQQLNLPRIASFCRWQILECNPHHLIGKQSLDELVDSEDFQSLVGQLKRRYPLERAEQLLAQLNVTLVTPGDAYDNDEEFAADSLGMSIAQLEQWLQDNDPTPPNNHPNS